MAKPLQKERDNRSAEKRDLTFHAYNITPESAHTSILLLESLEPEILCQTLRAITKFSAQDMQNRQVLFDLEAIRYILPHVDHPEMNIKRFALKALAQLCQLPQGPEQVLDNPQNLRRIAFMLPKIEDIFVLEFASLCLAELTKEPVGCEQLVSANILSSLFNRMKNSLDPDVQKNCLQTLSNLLDDPPSASEVTKNQQFSWPSLLALMQSKYLGIQHAALRTVDQLICRYKDNVVQKTFRASTGVLDLCDILESYEFRDVHTQVLGVLRNYAETEENALHVYQSGCILRLLAYLEMALPAMKPHCLAVLTKMSFTSNGRDTLSNLLDDPPSASEVTKNQQFSWPSLLALMQSKYLGIQHAALRTVDQLICRYKDNVVQKTFRASTGVLDLCDILESYEFRDVHTQVLGVLRNYAETEENALHVYQSGCILRLLAYLEMALPAMKPHCLAVLTKMSFTSNGRDALFETGTDLVFCHQLLSSNVELLADAAMGVANMTKLLPSAVRMSDTNIIEALCAILGDDGSTWFYVRINALRALAELCRIIPKAAFSVVEPKTFAALRNINKKFKDTPIEAQRLAVQCYINLQNYHVSTRSMLNGDFMQELINILQRIDVNLKIMTCTVLTSLMSEDVSKDLFTLKKGEEAVTANLDFKHIGLRTALCSLIAASVTDDGAAIYLELGTIHYMVGNSQARYAVSAWEVALEAIFRHHPSAKFAYTGRLDINDFTADGFYVQQRLGQRFCSLNELAMAVPPFKTPTYVALFRTSPFLLSSGMDIRSPYSRADSLANTSGRLPSVPDDVNLRDYLLRLKIWFGDPTKSLQYFEIEDAHYEVRYRDKCDEVSSSLKQRAALLAEFVAEQMSGLTQERDCSMPSVELHIQDLMHELDSCVIGLGWVRCGGALERAVLYKTLADRLGLPCSLHRTCSAHAWVEVAVPDVDESVEKEEQYPAGLLRANYLVDLTIRPGRLLPVGSPAAMQICGVACNKRYTVGVGAPGRACPCERTSGNQECDTR